ncbi:MAG: hypothetical protein HOP19_23620, partial [Acidobacteria bacterium]|nr:hypothetical protein [Acidobacteriota bacterium]
MLAHTTILRKGFGLILLIGIIAALVHLPQFLTEVASANPLQTGTPTKKKRVKRTTTKRPPRTERNVVVTVVPGWQTTAEPLAFSAFNFAAGWLSLLETGSEAEEAEGADSPGEAMEYYRKKRLPAGVDELPIEKYFVAKEQMRAMPLYSSAENRWAAAHAADLSDSEKQRLAAWTTLGPGNIGGRTRAMLIHPQMPEVMYAAGVAGGVWKTTNAGQTWTPLDDLLPNLAVCTLVFDPKNPEIIYAGTGEGFNNSDGVRGAGILKTADGGRTWTRLMSTADNVNFYYVNDLIVSQHDSQRLYAATRTGVWRTTDSGATWTRVLVPTATSGCLDLAARTDQPTDYLLATCGNSTQQGTIYRKTDAEAAGDWQSVITETGMSRGVVAFAPSNQNIAYAMTIANTGTYQYGLHGVFRSEDGGATWTARVRNTQAATNKLGTAILSNILSATLTDCRTGTTDSFTGQGWYDLCLAVDPLDENRVWAGGIDVTRSDDGGTTWGVAGFVYTGSASNLVYSEENQLHPDQHLLLFHPQYNGTTNQQLFVGNDGGLWRADNARAAVATSARAICTPQSNAIRWTPINNGYAVTQFYHGAVAPDGKTYFGGAQDNGTARGTEADGPNRWQQSFLADGGYSAVDQRNPNIVYVSTQNAGFRKSTDGGNTFATATTGLSGTVTFIQPLIMDESDPRRLYTGGDTLFRSDNGMTSLTNLGLASNVTTTGTMSAVAIAPTDANQVLFGMSDGTIIRTRRALALNPFNQVNATNESFTRPRQAVVSWLTYDPVDKNIAYVTYSTFGGGHVYRTNNGGASWTNLDGSGTTRIPDIPVHCLVVDPSNTARLYVGTDLGVFVSTDGGASWAVENTGFANVVTESLALQVVDGVTMLYAFTHGRGAYRVAVNQSGCLAQLAETGRTVSAAGSDLTVDIRVKPNGCPWKAESNDSWISVQPGANGTADGTVGMKVTANNGLGTRYGTVNIGGRSFTITQPGQPDEEAPTLTIRTPQEPMITTSASTLNIAGVAGDNVGVAGVAALSDRGVTGTAAGTTSWTLTAFPLSIGRNEIKILATDVNGKISAPAKLIVNAVPANTTDTQPPVVMIVTPTAAGSLTTTEPVLRLAGTASDNVQLSQLRWSNDRGANAAGG